MLILTEQHMRYVIYDVNIESLMSCHLLLNLVINDNEFEILFIT